MNYIKLAQDKNNWKALVNAASFMRYRDSCMKLTHLSLQILNKFLKLELIYFTYFFIVVPSHSCVFLSWDDSGKIGKITN